ncbi:hypothetical protein BN440_0223 [Erwinia amylovora MR1]|nr:hypothetical protein BN440_0223 [Erwinia amylovora MR1]
MAQKITDDAVVQQNGFSVLRVFSILFHKWINPS